MRYGIEFVGDEFLPDGEDFILVQRGGWTIVFFRERAVTADLIRAGWKAVEALEPGLLEPVPGVCEDEFAGRCLSERAAAEMARAS